MEKLLMKCGRERNRKYLICANLVHQFGYYTRDNIEDTNWSHGQGRTYLLDLKMVQDQCGTTSMTQERY